MYHYHLLHWNQRQHLYMRIVIKPNSKWVRLLYVSNNMILVLTRNVTEYHIFQRVSGCAVVACSPHPDLWIVCCVQTAEAPSNRPVTGAGHTWCVPSGSLKCVLLTLCFWSQ